MIKFYKSKTQRSHADTFFSFKRKKLYPNSSKCNAKRKKKRKI